MSQSLNMNFVKLANLALCGRVNERAKKRIIDFNIETFTAKMLSRSMSPMSLLLPTSLTNLTSW